MTIWSRGDMFTFTFCSTSSTHLNTQEKYILKCLKLNARLKLLCKSKLVNNIKSFLTSSSAFEDLESACATIENEKNNKFL